MFLIDSTPPERADAARNRKLILAAANRLIKESGIDALTMDHVAKAACVGVGTVYRRFGDLGGLANELLDEEEIALQQAFLSGPPPLGPGAPPRERVLAFLDALLDRIERQRELLVVAEMAHPGARQAGPPYVVCHLHLATLIRQVDPELDAPYLADAFLALLSPALLQFQTTERAFPVDRIRTAVRALAEAVLT
ncbi:TetR/AcrR family transcriptional regulator [Pseudonocardiaceae bacterium YIM PH 21723]|nr:TetR/AcrR family transcriptional regulator [Pseudonocardiaceae bacterium YIM PH 21723]